MEQTVENLISSLEELIQHAEWVGTPFGYTWSDFSPMIARAEAAIKEVRGGETEDGSGDACPDSEAGSEHNDRGREGDGGGHSAGDEGEAWDSGGQGDSRPPHRAAGKGFIRRDDLGLARQTVKTWVTRDGSRLLIREMGDDHLCNAARLVARAVRRHCLSIGYAAYAYAEDAPDMAADCATQEANHYMDTACAVEERDWDTVAEACPTFRKLYKEAKRRGLNV